MGRVLFLDLDVLIVRALAQIVAYPAAFALTTDQLIVERGHIVTDRHGRRVMRRFNSSVMVWTAGEQADIYRDWNRNVAAGWSTDQDWIADQCPAAVGMPVEWFPRISQLVADPVFAATGAPIPDAATVILAKKPKQDRGMRIWPWLDAMWGGETQEAAQ